MSDKSFENAMRDRLDNYRSGLDHQQLWDQVEAELYPRRKKRTAIWWWLGTGASVLLLLWLAVLPAPELGGPALRSETSEGVATHLPTTDYPTTPAAPELGGPVLRSETSEGVATHLPTYPSTHLPTTDYPTTPPTPELGGSALGSETSEGVATHLPTTDDSTTPAAPELGGPVLRSEISEGVATHLPTTDYPTPPPTPELGGPTLQSESPEDLTTRLPTTDYYLPTPLYPLPVSPRLPRSVPIPNQPRAKKGHPSFRSWSVGLQASAGLAGPLREQDGELYGDYRNRDIGAWRLGIVVGYRFHPRWSITTGIDYQRLLTRFEGDQLVSREEESVPVVTQRIVYADGEVDERTGTGIRTTSVYRRTRFANRLNTINIPLLLGYEHPAFHPTSLNWYLQGGALLNIRQQITGTSLNENGLAYDLAEADEFRQRIGWGFQLGGGVSKPIKQNLSVQLGVEYRRFFNPSTNTAASYRLGFNPVSIKAGIRWRF
ncbi:MAG: hypothetical protein AAF433_05820 [Bacteroidota bacterium]